ncbi:MAG: DUF4388 domain-containing protein [Leptolyngbya sp. SIO4C1]|nr:DUF4388 domain-containing protein [Leptolyngbya sp. SIO4C1]
MAIQGDLSQFSLPELLKFLQDGQKTGRLSIQSFEAINIKQLRYVSSANQTYFIWFRAGRIITMANRLDGLGLLTILQQRHQLSLREIPKIVRYCPAQVPLGSYLSTCGVLQPRQLSALFSIQVMQQMLSLFQLSQGQFRFVELALSPYLEMTGLSIQATAATLPALRVLKDWHAFQDKLPSGQSGLKLSHNPPQLRLSQIEKQLLHLVDGQQPLVQLAPQLGISLLALQKMALRLIYAGLAREVPLVGALLPVETMETRLAKQEDQNPHQLSNRFIESLTAYLQKSRFGSATQRMAIHASAYSH